MFSIRRTEILGVTCGCCSVISARPEVVRIPYSSIVCGGVDKLWELLFHEWLVQLAVPPGLRTR
jgi:hypothetical protein